MGLRAAAALCCLLGVALSMACSPATPVTAPPVPPPAPGEAEGHGEEDGPAAAGPAQADGPAQGTTDLAVVLPGKRICLDPGHDANSPGAAARDASGRVIFDEHVLTLEVAYRLKPLLEAEGFSVCVTRTPDGSPVVRPRDENGNGRVEGWERAQAKIDYINAFGAHVLVSIHFNGISDPSVRGTEVYYSDTGPHEAGNRSLASNLLESLVAAIRSAGYQVADRGIRSDNYKPYGRLWILGHNDQLARKALWEAGALVEVLFLTNPDDVGFLQRPDALDVIARGLREGIVRYWSAAHPPPDQARRPASPP
ncbi:MAG TPA: N-acetylmuramoyl-L-alanine amidase [Dehalococcoidia bacterium]|nr:N-acetylmuramoyl-L-alanine amidase [Dehalococcoidia bacterium]